MANDCFGDMLSKIRIDPREGVIWAEKAGHLRLLQQAYSTILSTRGSSAYEVALIFCEEDDADSLFRTLDGPNGLERGASCFKSRHGRRFAHLFPSNGLAIATIASLSHGRSIYAPLITYLCIIGFCTSNCWILTSLMICILLLLAIFCRLW